MESADLQEVCSEERGWGCGGRGEGHALFFLEKLGLFRWRYALNKKG